MSVTSPPYFGLRDYGIAEQIGLEATPEAFVAELVAVFREVRRVLRDDGTLWLNLGDSYVSSGAAQVPDGKNPNAGVMRPGNGAKNGGVSNRDGLTVAGLPAKNLLGIPWRVAFALQADGWWLRQDIIWSKPNPMPESVQDRCTKAHEYLFLLSKSPTYFCDMAAIAEASTGQAAGNINPQKGEIAYAEGDEKMRPRVGLTAYAERTRENGSETRNKRSVWTVATQPFKEAHFATFPPDLIEPCIKAGCPVGGTVLDPFGGAGTTGLVADRHQRDAILIELNPAYADMAHRRIVGDAPLFAETVAETMRKRSRPITASAPGENRTLTTKVTGF
jgi:DNA modification methylase